MKFDQYFAGTTVPTLNRNDIHKIKVAIPKSIDEQIEIVKKIDSADQIIETKEQKIQKLERLKKALMQNLLTGKVRVKV
jgi:type I restriction enzyme S subunit